MKLFYWGYSPNFGDQLNPWLWPKLMGDIFADGDADKSVFVGIGTLLGIESQAHYPPQALKAVMGAGAGYGQRLSFDEKWKFYAVRGPLTAERLGLDARLAVTDGAVLLRTVPLAAQKTKKYPVSYMPHWESRKHWDWTRLENEIGLHIIDPTDKDVDKLLGEIAASELVIAEAMHGAIVADALRVPWIPVKMHGHILDFKWRDWCASLELSYEPVQLEPLFSPHVTAEKVKRRLDAKIRVPLLSSAIKSGVTGALRGRYTTREARTFEHLRKVAQEVKPSLSKDAMIESRTQQLMERVEEFKADYARGIFG